MRVLVVEDDSKIASFVVKGLRQHGFAADHARDGEEGLLKIKAVAYDAVILDIMLPRLDGLSLLRQLRNERIPTPVLLLSAKVSVEDRVSGLQAGADDYMWVLARSESFRSSLQRGASIPRTMQSP